MKEIVVISGKGGTGKTVITACFASLAENKVVADCDVDAADLHLLLHPKIKQTHKFKSGKTAVIDKELCVGCQKCLEVCRFSAIINDTQHITHNAQRFFIDPISCEGCGICSFVCPQGAIKMEENTCGEWFISDTSYGPFVHAKLGIAEENSGKLVATVRQEAKQIAGRQNRDYIIIDGPPGIGCPVIACLGGIDIALVVTEPTFCGIYDMQRIIKVTQHFGVKTCVCINKCDLNPENSQAIKKWCKDSNVEVIGEVGFDSNVSRAMVNGKPIVEYQDNSASSQIRDLWSRLKESL
ncbi:MAG: ATP-binding protein [Candidatus Omnitrophota bacterium]|nr:ATP-binding protein [Candidatus Omnitrophota bacterium]